MNSLDRALGCFVGSCIGDALGSRVEFQASVSEEDVRAAFQMQGGGPHRLGPGQVTDDCEMATAALTALLTSDLADEAAVVGDLAQAYCDWYNTRPFDVGRTCTSAFSSAVSSVDMHVAIVKSRNSSSKANGALMRLAPLIVAFHKDDARVRRMARRDSELSHPSELCVDANEAFAAMVAALIRGDETHQLQTNNSELRDILRGDMPETAHAFMGHLKHGLGMAVYCVQHGLGFREAMKRVLKAGGDTDTNAAIVGCALGACHGLSGLPREWVDAVMNPSTRDAHRRPAWVCPRGKLFAVHRLFELSQ